MLATGECHAVNCPRDRQTVYYLNNKFEILVKLKELIVEIGRKPMIKLKWQ
jgi:hypothetical protein